MCITKKTLLAPAVCCLLWGGAQAAPNILLIIGDDMGVDALASYGVSEHTPATAALDELANEGVRFTNFWAQPVCSPHPGHGHHRPLRFSNRYRPTSRRRPDAGNARDSCRGAR